MKHLDFLKGDGVDSPGRFRLLPIWCAVALCVLTLSGCSRVSLEVQQKRGVPVPLLKAGHPVDWWFVFKLNAEVFPGCGGGVVTCPFGGSPQSYVSGQQYAVANSDAETLQAAGGNCLGDTKDDPVGATFDEVYNGNFHYVVWNDQFYGDPVSASCDGEGCNSPWGHSKGLLAWNEAGEGLVMQVSTPSWPGAGSAKNPRSTDGNTLGCIKDDNIKVSQHFFALRLTKDDLLEVLDGMRNASVVTDPNNPQIVKNGGPPEVQTKVAALGGKTEGRVVRGRLSTGVRFLVKPSGLHVPPWQMVSAELGGLPLRAATWWAAPQIPTTSAQTPVDCWDSSLGKPGAVEIATGGKWLGKEIGLTGGLSPDSNHAKIGVSTKETDHLAIFGDLNQQGALSGNCDSSQNGRGGMFFVLDNVELANSLKGFLRVPFTPAAPRWVRWIRQNRGVFVSLLICLGLLAIPVGLAVASSLRPKAVALTSIEEIVASDSPVTSLKEDRLGQRALVDRLSKFLRNPNTSPPLVLSLQARWGMGKSSVMRMLESDLKENRAAVTVWFNAWHHQREDQLLAYLLETIQKEAIPSWLTPVGLSFRFDLLRVRLFAGVDRLALVLGGIALVTLRVVKPELFHEEGWKRWLLNSAVAAAALPLLSVLMAFKSNPEKLAEKKGGGLVDTFKELLRLPSLVGKSDVRQEFASNLKDVVEALSPQRLVIFLDDLDRCKPDQVVQILEAINFLSSVASCIIVVGADYEKVETLVAMQFEQIALREAENMGSEDLADPIGLRIAYARNYLKKIVNLRLNLRLPTPMDIARMLRDKSVERRGSSKPLKRVAAVGVLLLPILLTLAAVSWWPAPPEVAQPTSAVHHEAIATVAATAGERVEVGNASERKVVQASPILFDNVSGTGRLQRFLVWGCPTLIAVVLLVYRFSRPRRMDETQDAKSFADALETRSQEIYVRCKSPREVRRFLNYLRLIATEPSKEADRERVSLRKKYAGTFDQNLVDLAATDAMPQAGPEGPEIEQYFKAQCDLFGLDFRTFLPKEAGSKQPVDAATEVKGA